MQQKTFTNPYLSYSRLRRFEECPLSYRLHYVEKKESNPGIPLRFGSAIHAVLERLIQEVIDEEHTGRLSEERAMEIYREIWSTEKLTGVEIFQEGIEIIKGFVRDQGALHHRDILSVEKEFELQVGEFKVRGFIDRIDCVDNETIEIQDYKTNRQLYSRDELDSNLQLSIYQIAGQQLWPWAKKVKLTFNMVRHGILQRTERTPDQLDAALEYVKTLGRMTEQATEFPARLNSNCIYCDHRSQCPAYAAALEGTRDFICEDLKDLEAVSKEREEVSRLAKVLYARKKELEGVLKSHLKDNEQLVLNGVRYKFFNVSKVEHPLLKTLELLESTSGISREELLGRVANINKKALDKMVKELGDQLDRPVITLLKAELEATAKRSFSSRFWAKEVSA